MNTSSAGPGSVDRLKRMINASGFKVKLGEVEEIRRGHSAVQLACVVGAANSCRDETVKTFEVRKARPAPMST